MLDLSTCKVELLFISDKCKDVSWSIYLLSELRILKYDFILICNLSHCNYFYYIGKKMYALPAEIPRNATTRMLARNFMI